MEDCIYEINEETDIIEGKEVRTYGISVFSSKAEFHAEPIGCVSGITSDYSFICKIFNYLTEYKPSPIHLRDIIEDILARS